MKPLNSFTKGIAAEFREIKWPTRKETMRLVLTVLGFSIGVSIMLGAADYIFLRLMDGFIIK
ncbi:MAG: preprotein translocase subunit SecE [Candidatus Colwellbacteria bacterium]|nr:preprotein translocase subunit SecE [Candidatus Colwellbacteria bacterium]